MASEVCFFGGSVIPFPATTARGSPYGRLPLWTDKVTPCRSNALSMNAHLTVDSVIDCAWPGISGMHAAAAHCMRSYVRTLMKCTETPEPVVVIWNDSFVLSCYGCVLFFLQPASLNCLRPARSSTMSDDLLDLCDSSAQPDPHTSKLQSATTHHNTHYMLTVHSQAQHDCVTYAARVSLLRAGPAAQSSLSTSSSRSWNRLHLAGNTCCT